MRAGTLTTLTLLASTATSAAPQGNTTLVFESHVGQRPAKLAPFIDAINNLLETRGYAAYPATVRRIAGSKLPLPGILDPNLTSTQLAELHTKAFAKYRAAQWSEALTALLDARDKTRRNPALVANDISNHDQMFRTMVAIADCYNRLGENKTALAAMRDVRRVYPTRPVSRTDAWGPLGEQLYLQATLEERGVLRGRLSFGAGDPNAQVSIEGQQRGIGNVSLADMLPGMYRVFVRTSATDIGRQYDVEVLPGQETRFAIDIHMDKLLDVSGEYIALTYPSENERSNECKVPNHFAELWTESGASLVFASGEENGRPIVTGIRCRDGVQVRRGVIFTDTEDYTSPEKLVPFLDDLTTQAPSTITDHANGRERRGWRQRKAALGATIVGGGLVLGGAITVALDRNGIQRKFASGYDLRDSGDVGVYIAAAGGLVASAGIVGLKLEYPIGPYLTVTVGSAAVGMGIAMLAIDQDAVVTAGTVVHSPYYHDTGKAGFGFLVGGAAVAAAGVIWWRLAPSSGKSGSARATRSPIATFDGSNGFVGWAGTF